jgi:outer membrane lipoprotein SlyB
VHRIARHSAAVAHEKIQVAEAPAAALPPAPSSAPAVEAPKPPPGILGVVESVRAIEQPAEKSNGAGPIIGGIAGALLGHQVGHGTGRTIATVIGAAGGALTGKEVEKKVNSTKHWEVRVHLDDGTSQTLRSDVEPFWHGGERVRLLDGRLTPA